MVEPNSMETESYHQQIRTFVNCRTQRLTCSMDSAKYVYRLRDIYSMLPKRIFGLVGTEILTTHRNRKDVNIPRRHPSFPRQRREAMMSSTYAIFQRENLGSLLDIAVFDVGLWQDPVCLEIDAATHSICISNHNMDSHRNMAQRTIPNHFMVGAELHRLLKKSWNCWRLVMLHQRFSQSFYRFDCGPVHGSAAVGLQL
ncbi:hypothetical protein BJX99DRAFT_229073, partial [Aspergillus californicus]